MIEHSKMLQLKIVYYQSCNKGRKIVATKAINLVNPPSRRLSEFSSITEILHFNNFVNIFILFT